MSLITLPAEIQNLVFADEGFTRRDHKSLRLTAPRFRTTFNATLFRRVHVSKARKDWDLLLEMTARPELADFVDELVWYELFDVGDMLERRREESGAGSSTSEDETPLLSAEDLFCVPEGSHNHSDPAIKPTMDRLQQEFLAAVDRLPRLGGFVSMPMPAEHVLATAPRVVRARELYRWLVGDSAPAHKRRQARQCPAQGYEAFLQAAMARAGLPLRLLLVDPPWALGDGPRSPLGCAGASRLVDVTLCADWTHQFSAVFGALLEGATSLRRLKVCNRAGWRVTAGEPLGAPAGFSAMPELTWPRLEALHLVSVPLSDPEEFSRYEDDGPLLRFLGRHQARLRHVVLERCGISHEVVNSISHEPELALNLETFRVVSAPRYERAALVEEGALLGILNGEAGSLGDIAHVLGGQLINTFRPAGSEPARAEGDGLDCAATDPGVDTRSDGHLALHGTGYARRKRAEGAARWEMGQAHDNIYAWQSAGPNAFETSVWHFRHRTGEDRVGDEPLAHFLEWDSEDGGDLARETPFGEDMLAILGDPRTWEREGEIPARATPVESGDFVDYARVYLSAARDRLIWRLRAEAREGEETW